MIIISDKKLEYISLPFRYISMLLLAIYITTYMGLLYVNPIYINRLTLSVNVFVCLFLLYKFNPLRTHTLNKFDGKIIFASALFMLTNLGITEIIANVLNITIRI